MKRILTSLILTSFLLACEKEIDMDYRTVEPLYVTEASLTTSLVTARLTTTRSVMASDKLKGYVDRAVVTIAMAGTESLADTLTFKGNGLYELPYYGEQGQEYTIDICIDGRHYTSSSTMRGAPVINSFEFVWKDVMTERILFADLRLQDIPNEMNYYFIHLYRNNLGYRWAVMRDTSNPGGELQQLLSCTTEREMQKETDSDILREGDYLRLEVRSIDKPAYDYLYSLQLMDNTGTNPIANFTGGMLGYFSAYQSVTRNMVFSLETIQ